LVDFAKVAHSTAVDCAWMSSYDLIKSLVCVHLMPSHIFSRQCCISIIILFCLQMAFLHLTKQFPQDLHLKSTKTCAFIHVQFHAKWPLGMVKIAIVRL